MKRILFRLLAVDSLVSAAGLVTWAAGPGDRPKRRIEGPTKRLVAAQSSAARPGTPSSS
jgi:hypothetical protein